jgi:hypothetical protein
MYRSYKQALERTERVKEVQNFSERRAGRVGKEKNLVEKRAEKEGEEKYTSGKMSAGAKTKLAMFLPSTRDGRMATRVSKFIHSVLQDKYQISVLGKCQRNVLKLICLPVCLFVF